MNGKQKKRPQEKIIEKGESTMKRKGKKSERYK